MEQIESDGSQGEIGSSLSIKADSSSNSLLCLLLDGARDKCESFWWKNLKLDPSLAVQRLGKGRKRKAVNFYVPEQKRARYIDVCEAFESLTVSNDFKPVKNVVMDSLEQVIGSIATLQICECDGPGCVPCTLRNLMEIDDNVFTMNIGRAVDVEMSSPPPAATAPVPVLDAGIVTTPASVLDPSKVALSDTPAEIATAPAEADRGSPGLVLCDGSTFTWHATWTIGRFKVSSWIQNPALNSQQQPPANHHTPSPSQTIARTPTVNTPDS